MMNLIGPLANPAGVERQVIGVADAERAPVVADALARLAPAHALVVHADVGMDEIAPAGRTAVWEVRGETVERWSIDPKDHGLATDDLAALGGGDPPDNAQRIVRLFDTPTADPSGRAAVQLNGGAAIYVAGLASSYAEGVELAGTALEEGGAATALATLRREGAASTSE